MECSFVTYHFGIFSLYLSCRDSWVELELLDVLESQITLTQWLYYWGNYQLLITLVYFHYISCRDSVYFILTTTCCRFETILQFWHLFNLLFIFFQISNEHCAAYLPHKYMIRALCLWGSYGWNVDYSKDVPIIQSPPYE